MTKKQSIMILIFVGVLPLVFVFLLSLCCLIVQLVCPSRQEIAEQHFREYFRALRVYQDRCGEFPDTEQGLLVLVGSETRTSYLAFTNSDNGLIVDPWGHQYRYRLDSERIAITSAGADGKFGTEDDIEVERWTFEVSHSASNAPQPESGAQTEKKTRKSPSALIDKPDRLSVFEEARTSHSGNLKDLALFLVQYSFQNKGQLPKDLGKLMDDDICADGIFFVCHGVSKTKKPRTGDDIRKGQCDYAYYGTGTFNGYDKTRPIVLTKPGIYPDGKVLALYSDGHVELLLEKSETVQELRKHAPQ